MGGSEGVPQSRIIDIALTLEYVDECIESCLSTDPQIGQRRSVNECPPIRRGANELDAKDQRSCQMSKPLAGSEHVTRHLSETHAHRTTSTGTDLKFEFALFSIGHEAWFDWFFLRVPSPGWEHPPITTHSHACRSGPPSPCGVGRFTTTGDKQNSQLRKNAVSSCSA